MKRAAAIVAALFACVPLSAAEPIQGRWVTGEKDAVVAIAPCGPKLCGRIDRFLVAPPKGVDQRDVNNKDPALRNRKLLGMAILSEFTEESDLWRGTIYDPKSGKTYRSVIRRKGANVLEVKGCLGPFCQTQTWQRAR
ncbi:DUF2147 domain-containing protein [Erythrobacter mangrovi]|uniref:DUF2147 domain-containing protein n=1 Tax=Erythrobacter mangrovi TaxID=2739433 RepID=A0A7D4CCE7_9SPHN|nr:DUF2147 domain-containing protein [Erythrobacter mangrovi]QKG70709.1 DUF2147 domain-containing protein [Erythrobacter mangrovi]